MTSARFIRNMLAKMSVATTQMIRTAGTTFINSATQLPPAFAAFGSATCSGGGSDFGSSVWLGMLGSAGVLIKCSVGFACVLLLTVLPDVRETFLLRPCAVRRIGAIRWKTVK